MKIAARDTDRFLTSPPPNLLVALFYGQDQGLISERAKTLAKQYVFDLKDPFSVTEITGDNITADPTLLYDSATAIPAMGEKRLVRVSNITDAATDQLKRLLDQPPDHCIIVMTSDSVNTRSKLVKLLDASPQAGTIGCYPDEERQLAALAKEIFSTHDIRVDANALSWMTSHLGSDRLMSRSEIEKLAVMAGPNGHIHLDMVVSALGDSAKIATSHVIMAAASGDIRAVGDQFDRAMSDAIAPEAILRAGMSYFLRLFRLAGMMESGLNANEAVSQHKPPIFFNEKALVTRHLSHWPSQNIIKALGRLGQAEEQTRQGVPAATSTAQAMLAISQMARQRR
jgi:DNA polymerase-3 subunit delta